MKSLFVIFHPYLGKWSHLTHIFQMGWNHQLGNNWWILDGICSAVFLNSWCFMHWRQEFELVCVLYVLPFNCSCQPHSCPRGTSETGKQAMQNVRQNRVSPTGGWCGWWAHQRILSPSVHPWNWTVEYEWIWCFPTTFSKNPFFVVLPTFVLAKGTL